MHDVTHMNPNVLIDETDELYFKDVEMQAHCAYYAKIFNEVTYSIYFP